MTLRALVGGLLLLAAPAGAAAFDRVVNPDHACPVGGTPQYNTIQDAASAASPGDQIGVCPRTYSETVTIGTPQLTFTAIGHVVLTPGVSDCLFIDANGVTVRGFEFRD